MDNSALIALSNVYTNLIGQKGIDECPHGRFRMSGDKASGFVIHKASGKRYQLTVKEQAYVPRKNAKEGATPTTVAATITE